MKQQYLYKVVCVAALSIFTQSVLSRVVVVNVKNPTSWQRSEVVGIKVSDLTDRLGLPEGESFVLKNGLDQTIDYQLTHDGQLLFDVSVLPKGTAQFKAMPGKPTTPKVFVCGKQYPMRKDDIAWENDRTGYRVYGPKFQRDGDIGYGIDVWCKNTPDPILENFYRDNSNHISFHKNHGYGLDCYNVGASLGCGAPALLVGDNLLYPYCYQHYEILDNGPLRFTLRLDFAPVTYQGNIQVTEHRLISLDKNSNFCKMSVWYDRLPKDASVMAGLVLHSTNQADWEISKEFALYADPTGDPQKHNFQIYVGLLFPDGIDSLYAQIEKQPRKDIYGHILGQKNNWDGQQPFVYYFGSAWSLNDVRTFDEWKLRAKYQLGALQSPLVVSIEQ